MSFVLQDTTDVQDPQVLVQEKLVVIFCQYLRGSRAKGCIIELSDSSNETQYELVYTSRDENKTEISTQLPAYCYDVYVYDWEEDGTMGERAVPVSTAVWNESCLTHITLPSSESGMQCIHITVKSV